MLIEAVVVIQQLSVLPDGADRSGKGVVAQLPLPAYDYALKASHVFNLIDARGAISPTERQAFIGRVRDLARGAAELWAKQEEERAA